MDQRGITDDEGNPHVPVTNREVLDAEANAPGDDDFDHVGHERQEDLPGGTRGGGNPASPLGR